MKWSFCKELISSDLRRELPKGKISFLKFIYIYISRDSLKLIIWFRIGSYLLSKTRFVPKVVLLFVKMIYKHIQYKTGIQVPLGTQIDRGLKFFHYSGIVIAASAKIGKNVSIHQGVTIGRSFAGLNAGVPTVGNNVVVFAGAKILGNIHIGDGAVVGANAVVTRDVPDNSVVAGIPARVISDDSNRCFTQEWGEIFCHNFYE